MLGKEEKTKNLALLFVYIAFFVSAIAFPFKISSAEKIVILLTFAISAAAVICVYWNSGLNMQFLVLASAVALSVLNVAVNGSGYGSLISFCCFLCLLLLSNKITADKKLAVILDILSWFALLIIIVLFAKREDIYYVFIFKSSIRFNPNGMVAVFLSFGFLSYVNLRNLIKSPVFKSLGYLIIFVLSSVLIYFTKARGGIIAWAAFHFMILIYILVRRHYKNVNKEIKNFMPYLLTAVILGAFVFTGLYVMVYKLGGENFELFGKNLFTGRERIWIDAYRQLFTGFNFIFGYSNQYQFVDTYYNIHNGILSFLCYFGIVPFALFVYLFYKAFDNKKTHVSYNRDAIKYFAVLAIIFNCYFEAMLADTSYMWLIIPFLISKYKDSENDRQDNTLLLVRQK